MNAHTSWGDMRLQRAEVLRLMEEGTPPPEYPVLVDPVPIVRDALSLQSNYALQLAHQVFPEWRPHAPHNRS